MSHLFFLSFALNLAANQEYYHQWNVEDCHGCSLDLSTFTVEELDNITSEYTLNNAVRLLAHKPISLSCSNNS